LSDGPLEFPQDWLDLVNTDQTKKEIENLQKSVKRSQPFGGERWIQSIASRLGLTSTLRPKGRPRTKNV